MTDPSTPVPSDEAVKAALRVAQVRRLPGSQAAVDQIVSAALTAAAPIIAAEAAAEARAATLREVEALRGFVAEATEYVGHVAAQGGPALPMTPARRAAARRLYERGCALAHFNPEANA